MSSRLFFRSRCLFPFIVTNAKFSFPHVLQASLSEEVIHPEKNMPIGIVGSLLFSTLLYCCVTLSVVGMAPLRFLGEATPIVNAILANACCTHSVQVEIDLAEECLKGCEVIEKPILSTVASLVSCGAGLGLMAACFTRYVLGTDSGGNILLIIHKLNSALVCIA